MLQNLVINKAAIHADMETEHGRYVVCDVISTSDDSVQVSLSVQIAPSFRITGIFNAAGSSGAQADEVAGAQENAPAVQETQQLVYSKDASLAFDAVFWGENG